MPLLDDPKHEYMAQMLAEGRDYDEAYSAIYPSARNPRNNVKRFLTRYPEILDRVKELTQDRAEMRAAVLARSKDMADVSKTYVMARLKEIVERCMQYQPVLDARGEQVYAGDDKRISAVYAFDARSAVAALKLLGLELGMFVQRISVAKDPFADVPAQDVKRIMDALKDIQTGRVIEHKAEDMEHGEGGINGQDYVDSTTPTLAQ